MGTEILNEAPQLRETSQAVQERLQRTDGASSDGAGGPSIDRAVFERRQYEVLRDGVADVERGGAPGLDRGSQARPPGVDGLNELENVAQPTRNRVSVEGLLGGRVPNISEARKDLDGGNRRGPGRLDTLSQRSEGSNEDNSSDGDDTAGDAVDMIEKGADAVTDTFLTGVGAAVAASLYMAETVEDLVETVVEAVKEAVDDDEEDEEEYQDPNGDDGSSAPPFQDLTAIGYRTLTPIGSTRIPGSHAPVDPVNPDWGGRDEGAGDVVIDHTGGVYDPPPDSDSGSGVDVGSGRPPVPQGGGPIDPVDPTAGDEAGGTGPINPEGPGRGMRPVELREPSFGPSALKRAGGFVVRTAVTVGITIAAVKLGGVMADRDRAPDAPAVSDARGSVGTAPSTEKAGSSEPFVEGGGKPHEPQTAGGSRPVGRTSDGTELSGGTPDSRTGAPAQRAPDSGPTRLEEEGSSPPEDEQGPTDLERAPNPQPEEGGDPDTGFEPGLED